MTYDVRKAIDADWDDFHRSLAVAFFDSGSDDAVDNERQVWEPDRCVVATFDGALVGTAGAFTRNLTVPGAQIPAAHVSMVGVEATHRRHGLLNRMIGQLHQTAVGLGETVAVLWASEARIYQRYGYGLAARRTEIDARTTDFALVDPAGDGVRTVPADSADPFRDVYDAVAAIRVGWSERDDAWWRYRLFDGADARYGATSMRAVVHDGPGGVDGYLLWRVNREWADTGPNSDVIIHELVAATPAAYRALFRFALSIDLTRRVSMRYGSIDEPLQHMVSDPRRLGLRVYDALWLRVLDVPGALAARRYAAPIDVVLEIDDPLQPANTGRWRLVGSPDAATCTATEAPADLAVDVTALGAAYLGGSSLTALAAAGKVTQARPGALAAANTAFGWHVEPSAIEMF